MHYVRRDAKATPVEPPAPTGTMKTHSTPNEVRVGDFILLGGRYQRIRDMRSAGGSSRVLHFIGRPPWIMRAPGTVYRPI
ncbi:hypothetical protein [Streptomyces bacillaris]|uniref:hypothetical protein n=1 Tax=Streptomyces bacillaris TaxID=68179 RepID=UPI0034606EB0